MENSAISWTDHTFNPWVGCTKVGPGCDHCYAEHMMDTRMHKVQWGAGKPRVRTSAMYWKNPLRWNANYERELAQAKAAVLAFAPTRPRVFCASLADVFDNEVPRLWRLDLFELIEATPHLDWLLLTKRIGNVRNMLTDDGNRESLPSNVWLGATVVNQEEADRDIPKLLATPARVRFLSIEPMLGPVDLTSVAWPNTVGHRVDVLRGGYWNKAGILGLGPSADLGEPRGGFTTHSDMPGRLHWVICGGESGAHARPMHPDWARSLRDQCAAAGVAFHFKQWGEWGPTWLESHAHMGLGAPPDPAGERSIAGTRLGRGRESIWPVIKVGKKLAGRRLDGVEHNGFPT